MQWQTPSLALTAQAFLLATALDGETARLSRILSSALGMVLAVMAMQLMGKYRFLFHLDKAKMEYLDGLSG